MIKESIFLFVLAFLATLIFTPVAIFISRRLDVLDYPNRRKIHRVPLPRWGGLAIGLAFFLTLGISFFLFPHIRDLLNFQYRFSLQGKLVEIFGLGKQLAGILCGSFLVLMLGMLDDRRSIPPLPKFLTQIIAAYVAMVYGMRISGINNPFSGEYFYFPLLISQLVTVFWLVGFMNTVNLADGLDGMAAGIVLISSFAFFWIARFQAQTKVVFFAQQLQLASLLAITLAGVSAGFLLFNFYPARIFMGDGGALFLGYILGAITVIGTLKTAAFISFLIPITVVALPVLDVLLAIWRRFRRGGEIFRPDREHLHHRLLNYGWTQREVVLLVYVITIFCAYLALLMTIYKGRI